MNPGELNTHIIIQKKDPNMIKEKGFDVESWIDFKKIWAKKTGLSGRIFYQAAAVQSESDVIFKIRFKKGITASMRIAENPHIVDGNIVYDNIYKIKSDPVDKTGLRKELYITASKVNAK